LSDAISIQFTRFSAFYTPLIATLAGGFLEGEGFQPKHSIAPAGKSAIEGLVDGLKEKAGIAASAPVELVEFPQRKSLWELLLNRAGAEQMHVPSILARWLVQWEKLESMARRPLSRDAPRR